MRERNYHSFILALTIGMFTQQQQQQQQQQQKHTHSSI
jgi:preprotein translocase subunit YajC